MTLLFVIGVLFIAGAAALLTRALALPRLRMSTQLRQIESYGFGGADVANDAANEEWSLRSRLNGPQRAQRRLDRVDRDLPELIDLLTATIEAGLGFAGSLQLVADRFHGPLGQELRLTLHEQSMGLSTEQALENLLERCETPSVRAFARAVSQGESLGVSIGTMMRNLATETRKRRRQTATEKVQKAPVKMLFPLVFFIFPALFIVLLYPALSRVVEQLGGH